MIIYWIPLRVSYYKNVAIVTASTSIIDDNSAVFITVFVQGLDFTKKMYKVLINPNQCISFGVHWVDDPTNPKIKLVFYSGNVLLPLLMQVTNCLADYLFPSDNKLQQFPCVSMSDEESWYSSYITYPTILAMYLTMKE